MEKLKSFMSDAEILALGRGMQNPAPLDLRVNTIRTNREEVLRQSEAFRAALDAMERSMRDWNGETLEQQIQSASAARSQWSLNTPPAKPSGSR